MVCRDGVDGVCTYTILYPVAAQAVEHLHGSRLAVEIATLLPVVIDSKFRFAVVKEVFLANSSGTKTTADFWLQVLPHHSLHRWWHALQ
jgi:hypothetical protein